MRISVSDQYPGHVINASGVEVYLDNEAQRHCVAADEEAGTIVRYALTRDGSIKVKLDMEIAELETVHGKVKIVVPDDWKPVYVKDCVVIGL